MFFVFICFGKFPYFYLDADPARDLADVVVVGLRVNEKQNHDLNAM